VAAPFLWNCNILITNHLSILYPIVACLHGLERGVWSVQQGSLWEVGKWIWTFLDDYCIRELSYSSKTDITVWGYCIYWHKTLAKRIKCNVLHVTVVWKLQITSVICQRCSVPGEQIVK
jgi:hypothetical protein